MALTLKKRLYADAIMDGETKADAAEIAGYSKATASQAGSRLFKDEDVIQYIEAKTLEREQVEAGTVHVKKNVVDPKERLLELLNDPDPKISLSAASTLMPYMYARIAPAGKKEGEKQSAIEATKTGKFATLSQQSDKIQ